MITVFYDGKCGLCAKEINHYRKIAPNGVFDWQDITTNDKALKTAGISLAQGLKILHVKDASGTLHQGVEAFIVIWQQLARWRILAFIIGLPLVKQLAKIAYRLFASWRFSRLEHCQLSFDHEANK